MPKTLHAAWLLAVSIEAASSRSWRCLRACGFTPQATGRRRRSLSAGLTVRLLEW